MKKLVIYVTALFSAFFIYTVGVQSATATTYIDYTEFYLDETTVPQGKIVIGESGQIRPLQDGPFRDFQKPYFYRFGIGSARDILEIDDTGHWKAVKPGRTSLNISVNSSSTQFQDDMKKHDVVFSSDTRPAVNIIKSFGIEIVPATSPVYRLYHSGLKVHLYTTDANENAVLATRGWRQEGTAWTSSNVAGDPVYRLYHAGLKVHLYTKDANEYNVLATRGWRQEGVAYRSNGTVPVYRLYHPGIKKHLYTKDVNEKNILSSRGWRYEGVAWNVE